MDTIDGLESFSGIGAPLSSVTDIESDHRFLTSGDHIVFYRVNGQDVFIDRVLYSRRDHLRILFPDLPQNNNNDFLRAQEVYQTPYPWLIPPDPAQFSAGSLRISFSNAG